jgi:hypothetical protein
MRRVLPERHLAPDGRDVIKLGTGLISTMTALVLGLLITSAKESYEATGNELIDLSANVVLLDHALADYGPETAPIREQLHGAVAAIVDQLWHKNRTLDRDLDPSPHGGDAVFDSIAALSPKTEVQHSLQTQASTIALVIGKTRWLVFEQGTKTVAPRFLVILGSWLAALFVIFGFLAPYNPTVMGTLLVCAIIVASAIFLILEMYRPFDGLFRISDASLTSALMHLGGD